MFKYLINKYSSNYIIFKNLPFYSYIFVYFLHNKFDKLNLDSYLSNYFVFKLYQT